MYSSEDPPAPRPKSLFPLRSYPCRKILQLSRVTAKKTRGVVLPKRDDRCTFVWSRDTTAAVMIGSSVTLLLEYLQTSHSPLGRSSVMANWNEKNKWRQLEGYKLLTSSTEHNVTDTNANRLSIKSLTQTEITFALLKNLSHAAEKQFSWIQDLPSSFPNLFLTLPLVPTLDIYVTVSDMDRLKFSLPLHFPTRFRAPSSARSGSTTWFGGEKWHALHHPGEFMLGEQIMWVEWGRAKFLSNNVVHFDSCWWKRLTKKEKNCYTYSWVNAFLITILLSLCTPPST